MKKMIVLFLMLVLSVSAAHAGIFDWITGMVTTDQEEKPPTVDPLPTTVNEQVETPVESVIVEKQVGTPTGEPAVVKEQIETQVDLVIVKEQVKCVFDNANGIQKCYTDDGKFGCSGTGTCLADVSGEKGRKQTWKSSCGGYVYTVIDGNNDYAEFKCVSVTPAIEPAVVKEQTPADLVIVKEQVKCVFANSNAIQKCYTDDGKFACYGTGTCVADVSGEKGHKQTWKSSCEGYAYTVIDGNNDYAEFKCVSETPTIEPAIVKEQVKCVFDNANGIQKCYTDDGKFGCSGTGTCVADVSGEKGHKQTWKSSCEGYAYTVIDGNNDYAEFKCVSETPTIEPAIVKEQVKCVFDNANGIQKCYTDDGKFGCSGTGTCVVYVSGKKGSKQTWKSSCSEYAYGYACQGEYDACQGGYAYTIIDGNNDYAEFKCVSETPVEPVIVKEQVKCVFDNTNKIQKCYTDDGKFGCSGTGTCLADVPGEKGRKQTWKSSCGGYAYTVIDGNNDYAEFKCVSETEVTKEIISGKGFRYAYWQCYNKEEQKQGSDTSCKSSETWQKYAKDFCNNKCYEDRSKCGVNSFSVSEECYLEFEKEETIFVPSVEEEEKEQKEETITEKKEEILLCKDSCPLDGKCYPFGYRKSEMFCSDEGSFVEQLKGENSCDNNFECTSNVCVNGNCISSGLMEKIINWFTSFFR